MLDERTVVAYLKERKIFSPQSNPSVEILAGGVSNVVLAITGEGKDLVLKQALPELKVKAKWVADQRRALVEARAIQVLHDLTQRMFLNFTMLIPHDLFCSLNARPVRQLIGKTTFLQE